MGIARHMGQPVEKVKKVLFVGTASTTYDKGIGLCYNRDYGTAANAEGERDCRVEVPSTSNNRFFAGVLAAECTLDSTGQAWVDIIEPGSVCQVALGANATVATPYLTCLAGGGDNTSRFTDKGFLGRGSVLPIQTLTVLLEDASDGSGTLSADGRTLTVTDSSDYTAGVDKVLILGGEDDGTGAVVPGLYAISSITNGTTIVLATSAVDTTAAGTLDVSFRVIDGDNALGLGYLYGGRESGLVTWVSPPNAGDTDYAPMMGGVSYISGGVTLGADFDIDLPDGTIYGDRIGFIVKGTMSSNTVTVDLDTAGLTLAGSTLNEFNAMDAANDACFLEWNGVWKALSAIGGTTEA